MTVIYNCVTCLSIFILSGCINSQGYFFANDKQVNTEALTPETTKSTAVEVAIPKSANSLTLFTTSDCGLTISQPSVKMGSLEESLQVASYQALTATLCQIQLNALKDKGVYVATLPRQYNRQADTVGTEKAATFVRSILINQLKSLGIKVYYSPVNAVHVSVLNVNFTAVAEHLVLNLQLLSPHKADIIASASSQINYDAKSLYHLKASENQGVMLSK